jgi:hypothetical protein
MEGNENKKEATEGRLSFPVSVFQGHRRKRHLLEGLPGNFPYTIREKLYQDILT